MRTEMTFTLSELEPAQSPSPYGGWTAGDKGTVFYDEGSSSWGYVLHGIGPTGLAYESEDVTGFASADEALAAMREHYAETQSQEA